MGDYYPGGSTVRVIAFDPGPTSTGWAIVDRPSHVSGVVDWVASGMVDSSNSVDISRIFVCAGIADAVAVETPEGYVHQLARGAQLLATSQVAGFLCGLSVAAGLHVIRLSAQAWRSALVGNGQPKDDTIKMAVGWYVRGMPPRTNVHVRDALGLAVVASWRLPAKRREEATVSGIERGTGS